MYIDYTLSVLKEYEKKKDKNALSLRLMWPTPAKLRDECVAICKERFQRRDDNTLRVFFQVSGDQNTYVKTIENFDIDKFRPLIMFLKKDIKDTDEKNIELLAWLIDFKRRPFNPKLDYSEDDPEEEDVTEPPVQIDTVIKVEPEESVTTEPLPITVYGTNTEKKNKDRNRLYVLIALMGLGMMLGIFWNKLFPPAKELSLASTYGQCMYWDKDHYVSIPCNQKPDNPDVVVEAMDSVRFLNFKRIMKTDTITYASIGKLWYIRKDNKVECYTQGGPHPIFREKNLNRLTKTIIDNRIRKGQ